MRLDYKEDRMGTFGEYIKSAFASIRNNKGRSFLTMLGIIIGVFTLVKTLPYMLGADGVSANSLSPFLTDVAIAMICSLLGVFYTTLGTLFLRKEKEHVEKGKDNFLSWIHINTKKKNIQVL